jgi:hypothetical protein
MLDDHHVAGRNAMKPLGRGEDQRAVRIEVDDPPFDDLFSAAGADQRIQAPRSL